MLAAFVEELRCAYASGLFSIAVLLDELGLETKHSPRLTNLLRGNVFEDCPGPLSVVNFDNLNTSVSYIRQRFNDTNLSIEDLASQFNFTPLVIRKVLSGELCRYLPGPIFKDLRKRPNPVKRLADCKALYNDEIDQYFNPAKYANRPDPIWLRKGD